jgi:serine phosphatase RsbU (regulator of sigma subunit)
MQNTDNEHQLLRLQARQASQVLSSSITSVVNPLTTALSVVEAGAGNTELFSRFMESYVGPGKLFDQAMLIHTAVASTTLVSLGDGGELHDGSPQLASAVSCARQVSSFCVVPIGTDKLTGIGYAVPGPGGSQLVVYAESHVVPYIQGTANSSAFSDLSYATYLGPRAGRAMLVTTDVPVNQLPLQGYSVDVSVPFGNMSLTLVALAAEPLGNRWSQELPWTLAFAGLMLTALAVALSEQLVRGRREAQASGAAMVALYDELDILNEQHQSNSEALQHALLPVRNPVIAGLDVATCYLAGADGVDIGGDWYSVISIDNERFAFVVGDVSGRGISAATVMARLRYTVRAYLKSGYGPDQILALCAEQFDLEHDGHFSTVLVGIGEVATRTIHLASAGHLSPLIIEEGTGSYLTVEPGLPIGVGQGVYNVCDYTMSEGSTLVAFTDGLVERRDEELGVSLERLRLLVGGWSGNVDELVEHIVGGMSAGSESDDIAVLAFSWLARQK